MQASLVAQFDPIRLVAFGDITASYVALGSPLSSPARMFRIINDCNTDMYLSLDGETDHFYVPAGSYVLYDLCTNRALHGTSFVLPVGTQFYVKYVADPDSGNVAVEACVGRGE